MVETQLRNALDQFKKTKQPNEFIQMVAIRDKDTKNILFSAPAFIWVTQAEAEFLRANLGELA